MLIVKKNILHLIVILLFIACNTKNSNVYSTKDQTQDSKNYLNTTDKQEKSDLKEKLTPSTSNRTDSIKNSRDYLITIKQNPLIPFEKNKLFSIQDFHKIKFLLNKNVDIYKQRPSKIDFIRERNDNLSIYESDFIAGIISLGPYSRSIAIRNYSANEVIIPVNFQTRTFFSIWESVNNSFRFSHFLTPGLGGSYCSPTIDTVIHIENRRLIIGTEYCGEGDDKWDSTWIREVNENDSMQLKEITKFSFIPSMKEQSYNQIVNGKILTRSILVDSTNSMKDTLIYQINLDNYKRIK